MTSDESVDVDWAVILSRLEIVRAHCGDLCNTNKSITKERFERCIYVFTLQLNLWDGAFIHKLLKPVRMTYVTCADSKRI